MAAAGALGVEGVDGAALERLDGVLDEAAFVQRVGVDHHLHVHRIGHGQAAVDGAGGGAPVLVQLQGTGPGAHLFLQRRIIQRGLRLGGQLFAVIPGVFLDPPYEPASIAEHAEKAVRDGSGERRLLDLFFLAQTHENIAATEDRNVPGGPFLHHAAHAMAPTATARFRSIRTSRARAPISPRFNVGKSVMRAEVGSPARRADSRHRNRASSRCSIRSRRLST